MDREIERKFFFDPRQWSGTPVRSTPLEQGYLPGTGDWEIRLRRSGSEHRYTMKSGSGMDRGEWEIKVTSSDFESLWVRTLGLRLQKLRERYSWKGHTVEVDRYANALEGLWVAEVEFSGLSSARSFSVPRAFGPELTYDPRFKNRALAGSSGVPLAIPGAGAEGWAFGVLPFRKGPKEWEIVIVSTRRQDRWIFPKGQPEPGIAPSKVALVEAREEAGITGKLAGHPIVVPYVRDTGTVNLLLFPVQVTGLADRWLELGQRDRKVIPLSQADAHGELVRIGAQWVQDFKGF